MKLISIVIPAYNEAANIPLIYEELMKVWENLREKYDFEIIFINDGSKDNTQKALEELADKNGNIKYIQFSRNFGKEIATTAGFQNVSGEAVILIDADLQHPPEFIPDFLGKWEKGADVVIGIRKDYKQIGIFRRFCNFIFYKTQNLISDTKILPSETDYRLIDKKVINEFNKFTERGRIIRGLIDWLGFEKRYVSFSVNERRTHKSGYNFPKLAKMAFEILVSHSLFPLKIAGYLGVIITLCSGGLGLFIFVEKYLLKDPRGLAFTGTATLAVLILFLIGIVLCCLGLIALYVANIHNEVVNRPLYIIKKKKNIAENKK